MKRLPSLILLLTVLGLASLLGGCGQQDPPDFHPEALTQLARDTDQALREGRFSDVTDHFHQDLKPMVSAQALEQSYTQLSEVLGPLSGEITVAERREQGEWFVCSVTEEHEAGMLLLTISMNDKEKIGGLTMNLRPYPAEIPHDRFTEEPVTLTADPEFPLEGLLTLPAGVERPPVVLLVHGSGASDRDETIGLNTPFRDIAYALAEQGIASLRYDKRFFTYPQAADVPYPLETEVLDDVDAALDLLAHDDRVDASNCFLLGHSLGGALTPAIAAAHPELRGAISLAGTLRPLYELSYDQNQEMAAAILASGPDRKTRSSLEKQMEQLEEDIERLRGDLDAVPDGTALMGLPITYLRSLKACAGANFIDQAQLPYLVLQGQEDFQVFPETDFVLWQETLSQRSNAEFHLYPGLNHLMMPTNGKRDVEEYLPRGTVSPQVTDDIAAFIHHYAI